MLIAAIILIYGATTFAINTLENRIADGTIGNYYEKIGVSSIAEARLLIYRPVIFVYLPWLFLTVGIVGTLLKKHWGILVLISYWISTSLFGLFFILGCMDWHPLIPDMFLSDSVGATHLKYYFLNSFLWIGFTILLIRFRSEKSPYSFGESLLSPKGTVYYLASMTLLFNTLQFVSLWEVNLLRASIQ